MANILIKFLDISDGEFIQVEARENEKIISIYSEDPRRNEEVCVHLDISTAIKLAKTLRTEINKIKS